MKNLLIYLNPAGDFADPEWKNETNILSRVQIDNSLHMGWKREDIIVVTNFPYDYKGVRSWVVSDDLFCDFSPTATKINVIIHLIKSGMVQDELYWFHDFDAFQLEKITEVEVGIGKDEIGLTDYGRTDINPGRDVRWSTGTLFFRDGSLDIFELWKTEIYKYKCNEEIALLELLKKHRNVALKERVKKLNITYNMATRRRVIKETYKMADKPLKVIHFHPWDDRPLPGENGRANMDVCVYGKNSLNKVLVTDKLVDLFQEHGIIKSRNFVWNYRWYTGETYCERPVNINPQPK